MKILVVNQPLNNRGDQAAHKAFMHSLGKSLPSYKFEVVFLNRKAKDIEEIEVYNKNIKYINIKNIEKGLVKIAKLSLLHGKLFISRIHPALNQYINIVKSCDVILCCPGGICMGGFMDWLHIWQLYVGMCYHKKIYYWGRSIGPFTNNDSDHKLFTEISLKLLKYFDYISLRDEISYGLAKNVNDRSCRTIDSAFLECPNSIIPKKIKDIIGDNYIIFVPNELIWHYKYRNVSKIKLDNLYVSIMKSASDVFKNNRIVMLPQLYHQKINDYKYFNELKEKSNLNNVVVVEDIYNSDIQQEIIRNANFVIGGRYHSVVFAINNEVPFLSLSYEHKMTGLLEILGLTDNQVNFETLVLGLNDQSVDEFITSAIDIMKKRSTIADSSVFAKKYSANTFGKLIELMQH